MDLKTQKQLISLLRETQVAALAVMVDGAPLTGLVPFVMHADRGSCWIHVSDLAQHARGLGEGDRFSLLIHASPGQDPLQTIRVSLQGTIKKLPKGSEAYLQAQKEYAAKYPQSEMLFSFDDFNMYELRITKGRFVAGFGQAYNLSPAGLAALGEKIK